MRLLDLFCCAGGAAMGYHRAGFTEIVGVDCARQRCYPFDFVLGDALDFLTEHGHEFDAIHASPPCKGFNYALNIRVDTTAQREKHLDLLTPCRAILQKIGVPWVIENTPGAPMFNYGVLCGQMFDTKVIRHRLFETSFPVLWPAHVPHRGTCAGGELCTVAGMGGAMRDSKGIRRKEKRTLEAWQQAMGIDWMQKYELTQAIPPAYTSYIGKQLLEYLHDNQAIYRGFLGAISMNNLNNRITGALLGLAVGDALGAPVEFLSPEAAREKHGILTEMVGGGTFNWAPGEWTDDTGMTLCMAQGILVNPENPVDEVGRRFLEWRKTTKDCGSTISAALRNFTTCRDWTRAAKNTPHARSGQAAGNGSLMRTLPVALAYGPNESVMVEMAARLSDMTHWDPQARMCCTIYCFWIENLLRGQEIGSAWRRALLQAGNDIERLFDVESLTYDQLQPSGYAGYCVETLEAAVWCCLKSQSYEETLVSIVNLAGESDTMAAVAGGAAGAYWGVDAIPARWLGALHQRDDLVQTAQRLADLRASG